MDLTPHSATNLLSVILFLRGALDPEKEKAIAQVNFLDIHWLLPINIL